MGCRVVTDRQLVRESRRTAGDELEPTEQPHVLHEGAFSSEPRRDFEPESDIFRKLTLTAGQACRAGPV